jgi:hypothetical protein
MYAVICRFAACLLLKLFLNHISIEKKVIWICVIT